nr:hypothetical protein [Planctomicrobium sp.]
MTRTFAFTTTKCSNDNTMKTVTTGGSPLSEKLYGTVYKNRH